MTSGRETVLVVDDDEDVAGVLQAFLRRLGMAASWVSNIKSARAALDRERPSLMLLDLRLPDGNGLDFLTEARQAHASVPVIVVTGEGELQNAVKAMQRGAADFLAKPVALATLQRALEGIRRAPAGAGTEVPIIGRSPALNEVWRQIDVFAHTDITVLLLGESGTGKELFARAIHTRSKRARGPFIELDCSAIAPSLIESELFGHEKGAFTDAKESRPGKFELASGGTLFLDEIGNLTLEIQAKLLRVVQERRFRRVGGSDAIQVDTRLVAATNLELDEAVQRGTFRSDLYFRLAELPLRLPPLRERSGDVRLLVEHFVAEFAARFGKAAPMVSPGAMSQLEAYAWPGNVRELANVVRAAVLRCGVRIEPADLSQSWMPRGAVNVPAPAAPPAVRASQPTLPAQPAPAASPTARFAIPWPERDEDGLDIKKFLHDVRAELELEILTRLVRDKKLSKAKIARYLKLDYKVLLDKLKQYGLATRDSTGD